MGHILSTTTSALGVSSALLLLAVPDVRCWLLPRTTSFFISSSLHREKFPFEYALHLSSSSPDDSSVEQLQQKADTLRKEIDEFERQKEQAEEGERQRVEAALAEKRSYRERYSAIVPILKPDGSAQEERCDFTPRVKDGSTYITTFVANLPLGIVLGESEDWSMATVVDEVGSGSNGETAGLKVGDIVHACTACKVEMEMPTWQVSHPRTCIYCVHFIGALR